MSSIAVHPGVSRHPVRRPTAPLRLTRRGRLVVTGLLLAAVLVVLVAFSSHSAATGQAGRPVPTRMVRVGPGDTIWAIASQVAAPGQTGEMVQRIEELNALTGPSLRVGQTIAVPRSDR